MGDEEGNWEKSASRRPCEKAREDISDEAHVHGGATERKSKDDRETMSRHSSGSSKHPETHSSNGGRLMNHHSQSQVNTQVSP